MADKKISAFAAAGALTGAELLEVVQDGVNVRSTIQDVVDMASGGGGTAIAVCAFQDDGSLGANAVGIDSVSHDSTGVYTVTFTDGFFDVAPIAVGNPLGNFNANGTVNIVSTSAAGAQVRTYNSAGSAADMAVSFIATAGDSGGGAGGGSDVVSGTFQMTLVGLTTPEVVDWNYIIVGGRLVTIWTESGATGTSNSTGFSASGTPIPAEIRPAAFTTLPCILRNATGPMSGGMFIGADGSVFFAVGKLYLTNYLAVEALSFLASGDKGVFPGTTFTYPITPE